MILTVGNLDFSRRERRQEAVRSSKGDKNARGRQKRLGKH